MTSITEPGLYEGVPETVYHADPVEPGPSLSSSIAKLLVTRSPRHAWHEHPRLRKAKALEVEAPSKAMDIGTAAHKLILGRGRDIVEITADDYRGGRREEIARRSPRRGRCRSCPRHGERQGCSPRRRATRSPTPSSPASSTRAPPK
jgi:hypothetical protein